MTQTSEAHIPETPADAIAAVIEQANQVILGKELPVRLALTCVVAGASPRIPIARLPP